MFGLETDRLLIRPWVDADRSALKELLQDTEVTRYIHDGKSFSDEDVDATLARHASTLAQHQVCMGAVIEKSSGLLIGLAGIQPLGTTSDLEIGWVFGRHSWGRGYATEAGDAALRYVLEVLKRPRVVAIIDPDNIPSKRVAARLGMEYEARYTGVQLGHRKPDIIVDLFARNRQ